MKDNTKKREWRDIGGTVCTPIAYLAYLRCATCSAYLMHTWPFIFSHVKGVVIAKIIKKTERRIEIVFLFIHLWFLFLNCDKISNKYFSNTEPQHDLNTIDDYLDIECVLNYFILLYFAIGLFCLLGRLLIIKSLSCKLHY